MKKDLWNMYTVKNMQDTESLKTVRKLLKPQVERRRRERMNRSLENLRHLLLQGAEHQVLSQRRVEKAEILEQTVLFLQTSVEQAKVGKEKTEGYPFQEGFSVCLEKAARFLQREGEVRGLPGSLPATLRGCLSRPRAPAFPSPEWGKVLPRSDGPEPVQHHCNRSPVCSRRGIQTVGRSGQAHPCIAVLQHVDPNALGRHGNTTSVARAQCSLQAPMRPCVWRPWP